jgi:hypothetical protein
MVKNIILYIFIYVLCVGCSSDVLTNSDDCIDCKLELSIPDLDLDDNNYYHLHFDWNNWNFNQIFIKIYAYVGHDYEYVGWTSDTYFDGCVLGHCEPVSIVNGSSYSDLDGYAYTMMGVYESNIGDTAVVYCGYYRMGNQYLDSVKVIIDEI